jgi:hypothetical protein
MILICRQTREVGWWVHNNMIIGMQLVERGKYKILLGRRRNKLQRKLEYLGSAYKCAAGGE